MGMLVFILIILFVIGGLLILLRSANSHKLPSNVKAQPYDDED
ncbi:MAG: hypothetical protein PHC99_03170 [Methylococcales bacterium]|nr:hypothetical protein [Methylococcales bacterium]